MANTYTTTHARWKSSDLNFNVQKNNAISGTEEMLLSNLLKFDTKHDSDPIQNKQDAHYDINQKYATWQTKLQHISNIDVQAYVAVYNNQRVGTANDITVNDVFAVVNEAKNIKPMDMTQSAYYTAPTQTQARQTLPKKKSYTY